MTATFLRIICVSAPYPLAVPVFARTQADFNRRIAGSTNSLAQTNGGGHVGDIKEVAGKTLPPNWLYCDGSSISRVAYPELFAEIGVKWGAGDGMTTFTLPPSSVVAVATPPVTVVADASVSPPIASGSQPPAPSGAPGPSGGNISTGGRPRNKVTTTLPQ